MDLLGLLNSVKFRHFVAAGRRRARRSDMEGSESADADPHMTTVSRHHFRDDSDQLNFSISIIEVPFFFY